MTATEAGGWALAVLNYRARCLELIEASGIDVIVTPTQAFTPPKIGTPTIEFAGESTDVTVGMCGLTDVFNALGWPAITVPCGVDCSRNAGRDPDRGSAVARGRLPLRCGGGRGRATLI